MIVGARRATKTKVREQMKERGEGGLSEHGKTVATGRKKPQVRDGNGRFVKGGLAGPGRPRGTSITKALQEILENHERFSAAKVAEAAVWLAVVKKDMRAIEFITDRVDGKTAQPVDITARIIEVAEQMGVDPQDAITEAERYLKGQ